MRVLIVADVGADADFHVGDEAMLEANLGLLRSLIPDFDAEVVSRDPIATGARHGVRSVATWAGGTAGGSLPGELASAVERSDALFVSGGGNLSSTWPDLLWLRVHLLRAAQAADKPVVVSGQTLGPALTAAEAAAVGEVLAGAAMVGVREQASLELARTLGVAPSRLIYQPDDAHALAELEPDLPSGWADSPWVAVTLDPSFASAAAADRLSRLAYDLELVAAKTGLRLVFVPHLGGAAGDAAAAAALQRELPGQALEVLPVPSPREARWLAGKASLVVASRYHPLVFACAAGVPALGLHSDDYTRIKLCGALAHFGLAGETLAADSIPGRGIGDALCGLWARRAEVAARIERARPAVQALDRKRRAAMARAFTDRARVGRSRPARRPPAPAGGAESPLRATREPRGKERRMISETQWQDFDRRGYLRLSGLLDGATITALRQRADDLALGRVELAGVQMQLDTGGAYEALPGAVERFEAGTLLYRKIQGLENDEVFSPLVRHPLIAEVCARIYGPPVPVSIFRAMVMNKPAGQGTHLPWHQDGGDVWQLDRDPQITFWVALDPATRENGCLQVIPGSHRLGLLSRHGSTLSDENAARHCPESAIEFLEMAAGDGVVFNNNLIHRSGTNPTAAPRRGFTACYMDGRTLSRLTGDHFPIVFGEPPTDADVYPFVRELRADNGRLRASAHESERYALSLEAEVEKLRAALTRESQAPPGPGASGAPPPRRLGQVLRGWLGR